MRPICSYDCMVQGGNRLREPNSLLATHVFGRNSGTIALLTPCRQERWAITGAGGISTRVYVINGKERISAAN